MQAVDFLRLAKAAGRKIGAEVKKGAQSVNPDVWREFAVVSTLAYTLAIPKREQIASKPPDGCPPLILVHGLGGNRGAWTPLRLYLRMNGRRRIYAFGYEAGKVENIAVEFAEFVREVMRATGEGRVEIVSHSLGGLISRYAIVNLDLAQHVQTLITLATPNQGTYAAQYANTDKTLAMRPDSEFMRDLSAKTFPKHIRFMTVASDRDIYVIPHESMAHADAENVFIPGLSHSQFLMSCKVFRIVYRFLEAPHIDVSYAKNKPAWQIQGE